MIPSSGDDNYKPVPYAELEENEKALLDDMVDWLVNDSVRSMAIAKELPDLSTEERKKTFISLYDLGLLRLTILELIDEGKSAIFGFEIKQPDGTWKVV